MATGNQNNQNNKTNAKSFSPDPLTQQEKTKTHVCFGIFFDGTSNNMIPDTVAKDFKKKHSKQASKNKNKFLNDDDWQLDLAMNAAMPTSMNDANQIVYTSGSEKDVNYHVGGMGYSNVAILHSMFKTQANEAEFKKNIKAGQEEAVKIYSLYIEGSGADTIKSKKIPLVGLAAGLGKTGVPGLVGKAMRFVKQLLCDLEIKNNIDIVSIHFYLFGFSRGSTCARQFQYFVTRDENETLKNERHFAAFMDEKEVAESGHIKFLDDYKKNVKDIKVDYLGIYDTVVSIGLLRRGSILANTFETFREQDLQLQADLNKYSWFQPYKKTFTKDTIFHDQNVNDYGYYNHDNKKVEHVCHICAIDEFRENFALTDLGTTIPPNSIEVWIPGCHSDVGGGFVTGRQEYVVLNKSIGNVTFNMVTESPDNKSLMKYKPISLQTLVDLGWLDSSTGKASFLDRFRRNNDTQSRYTEKITYGRDIAIKIEEFARDQAKAFWEAGIQQAQYCIAQMILKGIPSTQFMNAVHNLITSAIPKPTGRLATAISSFSTTILSLGFINTIVAKAPLPHVIIQAVHVDLNARQPDFIGITKSMLKDLEQLAAYTIVSSAKSAIFNFSSAHGKHLKGSVTRANAAVMTKIATFVGSTSIPAPVKTSILTWLRNNPTVIVDTVKQQISAIAPQNFWGTLINNAIGTAPLTKKTNYEIENIQFSLYREGGYSNIPLAMLYNRVNIDLNYDKSIFNPIPIDYSIDKGPQPLKDIGQEMVDEIKKVEKATRAWFYPLGGYCNDNYRRLRQKYLHFSSNDQYLHTNANELVNGPNRTDVSSNATPEPVVCRIIYHGEQTNAPTPATPTPNHPHANISEGERILLYKPEKSQYFSYMFQYNSQDRIVSLKSTV